MRLAIITSHPIQYYAPWFRYLEAVTDLSLRVFYLWDFGITTQADPQFNQAFQWDIPLLAGYESEFVPNTSAQPGTRHFWGLQNPTLERQVRAFQPDAVLLMNYNYASLYRFLGQWRHTPLLFRGDSHALLSPSGLQAALKRQWIRGLFSRFDACLYVGQANANYFRYHGVSEEQLFFSPHAIENERFTAAIATATPAAQHWKRELGIPEGFQVILFAGKLIAKKRPLDLLRAFQQAALPQTALLFVGSGELEADLRAAAAGQPHVYFAPFQNQSQMPRTYAAGDVLVLPSFGSGETWGLAVNEAMAMGKAAIVSSHVGCGADLVIPGKTGLVFPAGDGAALADCLREALADRLRLRQWGQAAQHQIERYSYRYTSEGLLDALSAVSCTNPARGWADRPRWPVPHPVTPG